MVKMEHPVCDAAHLEEYVRILYKVGVGRMQWIQGHDSIDATPCM